MYRVEEVKGRSEEAETGTQPASSIYSAPGVAVGAEVSPYALSQQYWCRRAIQRSQSYWKQGTFRLHFTSKLEMEIKR